VHQAQFEGGEAILENLDLEREAQVLYEMLETPVKIEGGDAAPVRAVLRTTSR
jgi:arylformamidase